MNRTHLRRAGIVAVLAIGIAVTGLHGCSILKRINDRREGIPPVNPVPIAAQVSTVRVATVQYQVEGNKTADELIAKMESLIIDAKYADADLIVFPELVSLDSWPLATNQPEEEIARSIATNITPALFEKAKYWSRTFGSAILVGSSPRLVQGKVRNTAQLTFPDGKTVLQDKLYLTEWERKLGWEAGTKLESISAPWGHTAILICYDAEFPGISQLLVKVQPMVLLIPSMTESMSGLRRVRWSAQARAVEHHAFVVVSGTVGKPKPDWTMAGQAAILAPPDVLFPEPSLEGEQDKPNIVNGILDIEKLRESRMSSKFYPARDEAGRRGLPLSVRTAPP